MQRFSSHCTCGFMRQALRVMAPGAVQRAAFEEDRGADARPIFGGEALQVQDQSFERSSQSWWLSRAMISSCSSLPMLVK